MHKIKLKFYKVYLLLPFIDINSFGYDIAKIRYCFSYIYKYNKYYIFATKSGSKNIIFYVHYWNKLKSYPKMEERKHRL